MSKIDYNNAIEVGLSCVPGNTYIYIKWKYKEIPEIWRLLLRGFHNTIWWGLSWYFFRTNLPMHTNTALIKAALNKNEPTAAIRNNNTVLSSDLFSLLWRITGQTLVFHNERPERCLSDFYQWLFFGRWDLKVNFF